MEHISTLKAYTPVELGSEGKLPERLVSISHDIHVLEGQRLEHMLCLTGEVVTEVRTKTDNPFCLRGSVAMYALLNTLREQDHVRDLSVLEQRVAGGKNDFDVAFQPESVAIVMVELGFSTEEKKDRRAVFPLIHGGAMIDILGRNQLPHFPWEIVDINGVQVPVVGAFEGILERMNILADPKVEDKQIKWGVDIKILKAYLQIGQNLSDEQIEFVLDGKWRQYQEDIRYQSVGAILDKNNTGQMPRSIITEVLGNEIHVGEIVEIALIRKFPSLNEDDVRALIEPNDIEEFEENLKKVIDIASPPFVEYADLSEKASKAYTKLLT